MAPNSTHSVTICIGNLKSGGASNADAQKLWEHYWVSLVSLARRYLSRRVAADEEDAALSALDTVFRGIQAGRYPRLADRDDLWRLLIFITKCKAQRQVRDELREKRGAGNNVGGLDLDQFVSAEPTPEFAAIAVEEHARLLALLDERQRQVALDVMAGYSGQEIADRIGLTRRWVETQKNQIRALWSQQLNLDQGTGSSPGQS